MNKQLLSITLSCLLLLQGCATTSSTPYSHDNLDPNEALLIAAENHTALIELYKQQRDAATSTAEKDYFSFRLGQTYLNMNDPNSTLFYIEPVINEGRGSANLHLLKSRALLAMGDQPLALRAAIIALQMDQNNPRIYNQLGLLQAYDANYIEARRFFNKARINKLDDVTVNNNLAMIDILEGNNDAAIRRLMPLYNSGQADDRVRSNLVVALIRDNRYNEFRTIYTGAKSEEEHIALFNIIVSMELRQLVGLQP